MEQNNIQKPITLLREDFIKNILYLCNNSKLPLFVVEDVLEDLIKEVHSAANKQLAEDKRIYQEQLNKQNESLGNK